MEKTKKKETVKSKRQWEKTGNLEKKYGEETKKSNQGKKNESKKIVKSNKLGRQGSPKKIRWIAPD